MQVADNQELTTSATLGGKQAISFGISDDPAFFHVLSSSLYNNPNLAVVRETICNQWDAHIEADKTHLPVLITIDKDNFIIFRDYGKGIPSDKIGAVYATYGASTKKANSSVTGGFGLGCKSPFAYTDSFQVTSWNQGKMSIYNVTKSSVETDGKPGVIPIITDVPSDETGLEVKFQLRSEDVNEFIGYIESIVYNGEIKAILRSPKLVKDVDGNHTIEMQDRNLPVLGMSFEPGSFDMEPRWHRHYMGGSAVFIRYGNVMYPAIESPATSEALGIIYNFMNIIGASRIVVQAAPSTLAIAPSRETLSNQKMTDDGIVDICVDLVDRLEKEIKAGIPVALREIEEGILGNKTCRIEQWEDFSKYVNNTRVRGYMKSSLWRKQYRHYSKYWKNLSNKQFFKQEEFKDIKFNYNRAMRILKQCRRRGETREMFNFLQRYVVLPALYKWKKDDLKWSGHIVGRYGYCELIKGSIRSYLKHYKDLAVLKTLLTKNVIITRRMSDCHESFHYHPKYSGNTWNETVSENHNLFTEKTAHIIHVGTKKGEADIIAAKYSALGYQIIDLTQDNGWDVPSKRRREEAAQRANKAADKRAKLLEEGMKGSEPNRLVSINCLLGKRKGYNRDTGKDYEYGYIAQEFANPEKWKEFNHVDVEKPVYYIEQKEVSYGRPETNPNIGAMYQWNDLTDEIKAVTIVCRNKIEVNKAIKRGAEHLDNKRYKEVMGIIKSKEFKKYVTEQRKGILEYFNMEDGEYHELFAILGIKSKVLDSLVVKPEFEWAYSFLARLSYDKKRKLKSLGCIEQDSDIEQYVPLTHLNSFKHLQAIQDIKGIFSCREVGGPAAHYIDAGSLVVWLKEHPEDIPGYKVLIRNSLTKRKGIYTR